VRYWDTSALVPLLFAEPRTEAMQALLSDDAAQLAAAIVVAPEERTTLGFVCLDARLSEAAEREGLEPIPAPT
jgi:uncharacterized protein with PIN domain